MYLNERIKKFKLSRAFYWLGIVALFIFFLEEFKSFLQPFILALIFWFLIKDLSFQFGRIKMKGQTVPRWSRLTLSFIVILSILFGVLEIVSYNVELIGDKVPEYRQKLNQLIAQLGTSTGVENITASIQKQLAAIDIQAYLSRIVGALTSFLGDFVIVWIYVIFLLIEETVFSRKMHLIFSIPERFNEIQELSSRMGRAVHSYLSVKTLTSLLTGLLGYALLVVLNVDFPELWAFLIFLLNFIPYLGSLVATLLPAVFAIFQFNSWIYFVWVFGAILAAQILVANFIEPRVMGRQLNLSPLVVILSLTFWGMIWGILGMVIAIPITSIAMIMLAQFDSTKYLAMLLSESGKIDHLTENK